MKARQLFALALCWLVGVLFLVEAIGAMNRGHTEPAFFMLLLSGLLVPPVYERVRRGIGWPVSRGQRALIGIALFAGALLSGHPHERRSGYSSGQSPDVRTAAHAPSASRQQESPAERGNRVLYRSNDGCRAVSHVEMQAQFQALRSRNPSCILDPLPMADGGEELYLLQCGTVRLNPSGQPYFKVAETFTSVKDKCRLFQRRERYDDEDERAIVRLGSLPPPPTPAIILGVDTESPWPRLGDTERDVLTKCDRDTLFRFRQTRPREQQYLCGRLPDLLLTIYVNERTDRIFKLELESERQSSLSGLEGTLAAGAAGHTWTRESLIGDETKGWAEWRRDDGAMAQGMWDPREPRTGQIIPAYFHWHLWITAGKELGQDAAGRIAAER